MRKLVREAVTFMLLSAAFSGIGCAGYEVHERTKIDKVFEGGIPVTPSPGYVLEVPERINGERNSDIALLSGVVAAYGFAGGFALWLFYRLVRFAVKG